MRAIVCIIARYSVHSSLECIEMHATVSLTLPRIFIAFYWENPKVRAIARIFLHLEGWVGPKTI